MVYASLTLPSFLLLLDSSSSNFLMKHSVSDAASTLLSSSGKESSYSGGPFGYSSSQSLKHDISEA